MKRLTVSLDEDHVDRLKGRVRLEEAESKSDALRQILDEYEDLHAKNEELHTSVEEARARRDELRRQLEERGEVETQVNELVEHTETQSEALRELLEERDRRRDGVVTRARRWLFGDRDGRDGVEDTDTSKTEDARA
jgi:uncharacterized coiled-coil DUF342 family protein